MTHHPIMTTPRFRFPYSKQRPVALTHFLSRQTVLTTISADFYRQLYITVTCMTTVTFNSVKAGLKNEMEADKHYGSATNVVICPHSSKRVSMAVDELSTCKFLYKGCARLSA